MKSRQMVSASVILAILVAFGSPDAGADAPVDGCLAGSCFMGGCVCLEFVCSQPGYEYCCMGLPDLMMWDQGCAATCAKAPGVCCSDCTDRDCGDDGCGGSCGTCGVGTGCSSEHRCMHICTPSCGGKQCGDDGCGGACGTCDAGLVCWSNNCLCARSCDGKDCGDDSCGGSCGVCVGGTVCSSGQQCVPACTPLCEGKKCGDDGCGGTCGTCDGETTCWSGKCLSACVPSCTGKKCGDDGCGASCGACVYGICVDGQCACGPACAGKRCGDDGCGGSCGSCTDNRECVEGICVGTVSEAVPDAQAELLAESVADFVPFDTEKAEPSSSSGGCVASPSGGPWLASFLFAAFVLSWRFLIASCAKTQTRSGLHGLDLAVRVRRVLMDDTQRAIATRMEDEAGVRTRGPRRRRGRPGTGRCCRSGDPSPGPARPPALRASRRAFARVHRRSPGPSHRPQAGGSFPRHEGPDWPDRRSQEGMFPTMWRRKP